MTPNPSAHAPAVKSTVKHIYAETPLQRKLDQFKNIPHELRTLKQWLMFKLTPRSTPGKWDKVPYYIDGAKRTGDNNADSRRLATFSQAVDTLKAYPTRYQGIGFAIVRASNISCIDFDGKDAVARHSKFIRSTWHEHSVSGEGAHAFVINDGTLHDCRLSADHGYDVFATSGFIAITGSGGKADLPVQPSGPYCAALSQRERTSGHTANGSPTSIARPWSPQLDAELRETLRKLNPDMGYDTWLRVGMALHSADSRSHGPAFVLWNKWSSKGTKYSGQDDLLAHWHSFKPGGGVTVSTVFGMTADAKLLRKGVAVEAPVVTANGHAADTDDFDLDDPARITVAKFDPARSRAIQWVWAGRIPRNELTLIAGEGGVGKGNMLCAIATALVQGGQLPPTGNEPGDEFERVMDDGTSDAPPIGERMPLLWLSAEDDIDTVLIPRLMAAGLNDGDSIYFETGVVAEGGGGKRTLSLVEDLRILRRLIAEHGIKVLVVDPITAYLSVRGMRREVDTHNASQLRGVLAPLNTLSRECGVTIVAVTHFGKDATRSLVHRINGSATWAQFARSVLVAVDDPTDGGRVLLPIKANSGRMAKALRYRIDEARVIMADGTPAPISKCTWLGIDANVTESNLIQHPNSPGSVDRMRCDRWLRERLAQAGDAGVPMSDLRDEALERGFSISKNSTFDRARRDNCVITVIDGKNVVRLA